jgi:hypothetical protein
VNTIKAFNMELDKFKDLARDDAVAGTKKLALDMFRSIVMKTPVGNPSIWKSKKGPKGYVGGHARANWQLGTTPNEAEVPGADPSGSGAVLASITGVTGLMPYQPVWIFNNAPYIGVLENGRRKIDGVMRGSTQAPRGMVAVTVAEVIARYK